MKRMGFPIRVSRWASAAIVAAALAVPALAGNVLHVGPGSGSYPDIQSAVNAAAMDDVILVRAGAYPGFTIQGKSLAVVAESGAFVEINSNVVILAVPSDGKVVLSGLRILAAGAATSYLFADGIAGSLRMNSCTMGPPVPVPGQAGKTGARLRNCKDVAIVGCALQGSHAVAWGLPGPGLDLDSTRVAVQDSNVRGGRGYDGFLVSGFLLDSVPGGPGADGCVLRTSSTFLYSSGSLFEGGRGGNGWSSGGDCGDPPGSDGGNGGFGIRVSAPGPIPAVVLLATIVVGGLGGDGGFGCGMGNDGLNGLSFSPPASVTLLPGSARRATMPVPVREATTLRVTLMGVPGETAYFTWSDQPGFKYVPAYGGVLLVEGPLLPSIRLGTIPASGTLRTKMTFPALPPAVRARTYFLQSYFVDASNTVRLGSAFAPVVLDSGS